MIIANMAAAMTEETVQREVELAAPVVELACLARVRIATDNVLPPRTLPPAGAAPKTNKKRLK